MAKGEEKPGGTKWVDRSQCNWLYLQDYFSKLKESSQRVFQPITKTERRKYGRNRSYVKNQNC